MHFWTCIAHIITKIPFICDLLYMRIFSILIKRSDFAYKIVYKELVGEINIF